MDYIEKDKQQHQDKDGNGFWNFKHIVGHEGPFRASDPEYKGSRYNVLIEWENGEITSEPLNIFDKDDPVTCAVYACKHVLLEEEGWKRFKGIAKREKKTLRMVNQSWIKATRNAPRYKFGYHIPPNYDEAMQFDLKNGNTLWREATNLEMLQLAEYDTFRDLGHKRHNALSFHCVRDAVTSKYVTIFHLLGEYNPADILSKHWAYALVWQTMNALLFAQGDTWDLLDDECGEE
jgi:hypothetical protein